MMESIKVLGLGIFILCNGTGVGGG